MRVGQRIFENLQEQQGEIIMNPEQSEAARSGVSNTNNYNYQMKFDIGGTNDRVAMREQALTIKREIEFMQHTGR